MSAGVIFVHQRRQRHKPSMRLGADVLKIWMTPFFVGGDAREVGAVENRGLQAPAFSRALFRSRLTRGLLSVPIHR